MEKAYKLECRFQPNTYSKESKAFSGIKAKFEKTGTISSHAKYSISGKGSVQKLSKSGASTAREKDNNDLHRSLKHFDKIQKMNMLQINKTYQKQNQPHNNYFSKVESSGLRSSGNI